MTGRNILYLELLVISLLIYFSKAKNFEFNPFDQEYRLHRYIVHSEYDTLMGECGYWNYTKTDGKVSIYYQFFCHERSVLAKGFEVEIDELIIPSKGHISDNSQYDDVLDSLYNQPIDTKKVRNCLQVFNIKDISIPNLPDSNELLKVNLIDTDGNIYQAYVLWHLKQNRMTRYLSYYNGKSRY